jgi:hypothetical protein
LDDLYSNHVDSRLISPPFVICPAVANPALRFSHWYSFYVNDDDFGRVQIREIGETEWHTLAEYRNGSGGVWTQPRIPLSEYAGQTVEIAFHFHADNSQQSWGWYIDAIELQGLTPQITSAPLSKYSPGYCSALISITAKDPCDGDFYYDWNVPESCNLIGFGPQVEVKCPDVGTDPYQVTVSVESATSHIASKEKAISIFTRVLHDADFDDDIDGTDLRQYRNAGFFDDLARFALEFGLIACQ